MYLKYRAAGLHRNLSDIRHIKRNMTYDGAVTPQPPRLKATVAIQPETGNGFHPVVVVGR